MRSALTIFAFCLFSLASCESPRPSVNSPAGTSQAKLFQSPDGRFAVALHPEENPGDTPYNKAELVNAGGQSVIFTFAGGYGYKDNAVFWSPDSRRVAVYGRSHRYGEPQIVLLDAAGHPRELKMPELSLPHERDPLNDGRHAQLWLDPVRWISSDRLLLSISGVIQQQKGADASLRFEYAVTARFPARGNSSVTSIQRVNFERDRTWVTPPGR